MSGPVSMINGSTGVNAEKSKLINSGQNTTCNEQNNHFYMGALEGENVVPDVINILQTLAQHVARTSNNQSTGADGISQLVDIDHTTQLEGYRVDVCDIVPPDPSAFPVASIADQYTRSMLERLVGYPLYEPEPFSDHSTKYLCNGVNIGDVGFVREDGTFEFLFNICPPQNGSINPPNLPNGFSLETAEHSKTKTIRPLSPKTCIFPSTVTKMKSGEYTCKGPEGAVLVLPEGAIQHEEINRGRFEELAKRHGVEWYEYTKTLGRSISNGSLYLVTSFAKSTRQWGIAVFHRSCDSGQGLKFGRKLYFPFCKSTPKYHWKGSSAFITKVANSNPEPNQKEAPNQCVFLRGYKIMIRKDIFNKLCNNQPPKSGTAILSQAGTSGLTQQQQLATRMRGGGGTDPMSILARTRTKTPIAMTQSDAVVIQANFNSSPIHPSDLINAALLGQNPDAKIALTHDDVWCDLLRDNFPKLNAARLANITRSYTSTVDEYGCVSLEKFSNSRDDESRPSSPALQEPIQQQCPTPNDNNTPKPIENPKPSVEENNALQGSMQCPTTPNEEHAPVPTENPAPSVQERNDIMGHTILYEVHGDNVIFQFGDGHYTEQERGMIRDHLSNVIIFTLRDINDIVKTMRSHPLTSSILNLPNPQAAYSDYLIKNKHRSCVKGTRVPLLQEMADWISGADETRMYILFGPADIGKSTIAYTIAARADALGLLGASFFFSPDGVDRDNGKMFFTAIAYQLCLYNELFAKAIEAALLTKPLSDATMKDPQEQLETLILEPLRHIIRSRIRPVLIVVDGLNECEEEDGLSVLTGLSQLVRDLPTFKVILTTRPHTYFDPFFHSQNDHKIFHVQNIKEDDSWPYYKPGPSRELGGEQLEIHAEGVHASDIEDQDTNNDPQPPSQEMAREQSQNRAEGMQGSDSEDKDTKDDTRPHIQPSPSQQLSREQSQDGGKSGFTSETWIESFVRGMGRHIIRPDVLSIPFSENFHTGNFDEAKKIQSIVNLPHAQVRSGPCFPGTREALLREMMDWMTEPGESNIYALSGLSGIGKSTIVYTLATRAAELGYLGGSFFFSRDEANRRSVTKLFSTIAFQLCVYDEAFYKAIGDVLLTERGAAATTQDPQTQLQVLILDPLQSIIQSRTRPLLIVVDALDECNEEDEYAVVMGLTQLVRLLPPFKVILTTRLQPLVDHFFGDHDHGYKIFHLQDIEDKVVDGDIRLYLQHNLSLEQVQRRFPRRRWYASDEQIDFLVRASGRLFIIASTAVRYIFDKSASNPAAQMQRLLGAFAQDHTPFKDLDHFYTFIARNVVPANCDNNDIVNRYQSVVGAIISVQHPLPISTLAHFINVDVEGISAVLDLLQSVILLGIDDVPHIYHISFPDYLMDQARCKDLRLRIDPKICHTQIVIRCFEIMDIHLKYNILGLGDPARFMSNEDGLKEEGITDEQLQEKITQQLHYACLYWANHLEAANIENADLMNGLTKFVEEHILHWLEVLSLIGHLDLAHHAIHVVLKLLTSTSSDTGQLLSDASRFILKFYKLIERSALHTYHSALPCTPTDSLLYRRYKEAEHNICSFEGGPEKWDALVVANLSYGGPIDVVKFSLDGTLFISCSQGKSKTLWDAATGTPISTIPGHRFAVGNDLSTVASTEGKTLTFYNVDGSARGNIFNTHTSSAIQQLAFSSESGRVAAALSDGTVWLWDSRNAELIDSFDECWGLLQFSPTGTRLAYSSINGINLRDGVSGRFIADLQCGSWHKFEFSGDGSRIAFVSSDLKLWNCESGGLIASAVRDLNQIGLAVSANGSLLATADLDTVTLWRENSASLIQIKVLELRRTWSMAFSLNDILAIATSTGVRLYNANTHSFISILPFSKSPIALAFSPDCTRLAIGTENGRMHLWDIRVSDASSSPLTQQAIAVTALTLSRDCSRLACGFEDGTVELWGTHPTKLRIASHQAHKKKVHAFGFSPSGGLFASGSDDGTIKLWNGKDGSLRGTLNVSGGLQAVVLSNSVLVAAGNGGVTLWSPNTLGLIHTFQDQDYGNKVSIAEDSALIAVSRHRCVSLLNVMNPGPPTITTFDVPYTIHTMTFLPDNSQLVVQFNDGVFLSLDLLNNRIINGTTIEHLIQLPNIPLWHDVPIWHCQDEEQHYFAALFSQHNSLVPVLWLPREIPVRVWTQGSSIIALGCEDGRVILLRLPTS